MRVFPCVPFSVPPFTTCAHVCFAVADKYLKEMRVVKGLTIAAVISIAMLTLATGTGTCGADTKRRVKAQNYITGLAVLSCTLMRWLLRCC